METGAIILILFMWNAAGFMILLGILAHYDFRDFLTPTGVYHHFKSVNWFGATVLNIFFNLLSPAFSICYWFYKLCTVGSRRSK